MPNRTLLPLPQLQGRSPLSSRLFSERLQQRKRFIQLQLDPASSNFLPANSNEAITQSLTVTNTQHGQVPSGICKLKAGIWCLKALAMRMRIAYKVNNQDKLEQGQVDNFPPGL
ncbi:hypothetical protein OPV22_026603 [Ensete ventricosum]|uniref:GAE domain-containing protein n=1 Tax=Ensete ventricosum TaxID=4639 RepID=A0AAV8P942_ENSVE|nr:hypothetical protein OPV22_026603 [Ensete ventricosum]